MPKTPVTFSRSYPPAELPLFILIVKTAFPSLIFASSTSARLNIQNIPTEAKMWKPFLMNFVYSLMPATLSTNSQPKNSLTNLLNNAKLTSCLKTPQQQKKYSNPKPTNHKKNNKTTMNHKTVIYSFFDFDAILVKVKKIEH